MITVGCVRFVAYTYINTNAILNMCFYSRRVAANAELAIVKAFIGSPVIEVSQTQGVIQLQHLH